VIRGERWDKEEWIRGEGEKRIKMGIKRRWITEGGEG